MSGKTAFFEHFDRHAHGKGLKGATTHYCPGCGHGLAHKYVAESLVELGGLVRIDVCHDRPK